MIAQLPPVKRITDQVLGDFGIPREVLSYIDYPSEYDSRDTQRALEGTGISVPALEGYADRLWDYWERNLDPELFKDRSLRGAIEGKVVVITGASSGIGEAVARRVGEAGGIVELVARSEDKLNEVKADRGGGGPRHVHPGDLSGLEDCDRLVEEIIAAHGRVDVLVNNAGRSIRRSIGNSYDRFHDFQRTMQLNYFGALKLIIGFLPGCASASRGTSSTSRRSARRRTRRASRRTSRARARWTRSRARSLPRSSTTRVDHDRYMPLVRTPMIAPTALRRVPDREPPRRRRPDHPRDDLQAEEDRDSPRHVRRGVYALARSRFDVILNTAFIACSRRGCLASGEKRRTRRSRPRASRSRISCGAFMVVARQAPQLLGLGLRDEQLAPADLAPVAAEIVKPLGIGSPRSSCRSRSRDVELPAAAVGRFVARGVCSAGTYDRASHAYGKAYRDVVRAFRGRFDHAPDVVAFPRDEAEVEAVLDWCAETGAAAIPSAAARASWAASRRASATATRARSRST
jgi:NAD(P)-dependent dehydrogenase (short-subunit alcohol dehydrogenase family)